MKLKWYGHSAFKITSNDGTQIILDPYEPKAYDGGIQYSDIHDKADIVTISHDHADHNWSKGVLGNISVVKGTGELTPKGIHIKGVGAYHDKTHGKERGPVTIYVLDIDGIKVCHLGDLGHELTPSDTSMIGPIDILLSPVGGHFTIDAKEATAIADKLQPKVVIPMHFKTEKCGFPLGKVDEFTKGKENVKELHKSEIEITQQNLPKKQEIWVMDFAN